MSKEKSKIFSKDGRLTQEAVENAKNVSIVEYLEQAGYVLQKEGKHYYSLVDHDSFKINSKKNSYYWNSRSRGGNAITLLMDEELFNMDYRSAVIELNKEENERLRGGFSVFKEEKKEPYVFPSNEITESEPTKAINYLVNDRKINEDLVNQLVSKKMIRQDKNNNIVYLWSKDGDIVGHNKEGTYQKKDGTRYKHISSDGDNAYGFSFQTGKGEMENHFYFESEVDAMSYVSLNELTPKSKYIAMRGVNNYELFAKTLEESINRYEKIPNLVMCVDNDEAGKAFNKTWIDKDIHYKDKKVDLYFAVPPEIDDIKDWNDLLKKREGKAFEEHERTIVYSEEFYKQKEGLSKGKNAEREYEHE